MANCTCKLYCFVRKILATKLDATDPIAIQPNLYKFTTGIMKMVLQLVINFKISRSSWSAVLKKNCLFYNAFNPYFFWALFVIKDRWWISFSGSLLSHHAPLISENNCNYSFLLATAMDKSLSINSKCFFCFGFRNNNHVTWFI
jgi:hypothetical protein